MGLVWHSRLAGKGSTQVPEHLNQQDLPVIIGIVILAAAFVAFATG